MPAPEPELSGVGERQWEVERATLDGRTKGHADELEDKEEERQRNIARCRGRGTLLDAEAKEWLCGASASDGQFKG